MPVTYYRWQGHAKILLYNYQQNKGELKNRQDDIIYGHFSGAGTAPRTKTVGDPTQKKALEISSGRYAEMRREVQAVDRLLDYLAESGQKDLLHYIDMAYFRRTNTEAGAAAKLGQSERTARRWNRLILKFLAVQMDWIDL